MKHLIVLIDALGWLTVKRSGFLDDLLPHRTPITTVFGYSSTAIPSLLTGVWPNEHGHWFLFRRSQNSPFKEAGWLERLPGNLSHRWRIRQYFQERWRQKVGIQGYFSLYDVPFALLPHLEPVEMKDTWGLNAFPGVPTLVDYLETLNIRYHVSDWRVTDAEKMRLAGKSIEEQNPDVFLLYLTEVDAAQHRWGTTHPQFENAVRRAETMVREFYNRLGEQDSVSLQVFSDHGMTDISRTGDLRSVLEKHGLVAGRDFDAFLDSTVARFWNIGNKKTLGDVLGTISWGRVLESRQLEEWKVDFKSEEYGELFFLVDPGVLILPSDMGSEPLAAMHGYTPEDSTSDACLLSDVSLNLSTQHITAIAPAVREYLGQNLAKR